MTATVSDPQIGAPPPALPDRRVPATQVGVEHVGTLGTILGVWAHPDDEAYCTGGLMAAARAAGNRVVVVTATRGEQGAVDPAGWRTGRLAAVRAEEMGAAMAALGVEEHRWLDYPDGACDRVPDEEGVRSVAAIVRAVRPDTVVTFGPEGYTGHEDHRAVSRWTSGALARTGGARLLHQVTTTELAERHRDVHERFDVFLTPDGPPVREPHELAVHLRLPAPLLERKLTALRAHASQTREIERTLGTDRYRDWVAEECLVDA